MPHVAPGSRSDGRLASQAVERMRAATGADVAFAAVGLADLESPRESSVADYRDRLDVPHADLRAILATVDDPALRRRLAAVSDRLCDPPDVGVPDIELSPREVDVLASASLGLRNDEIAKELSLSVLTVKAYLKSAMAKLGSHNRTEAVRLARRMGYLP